MMMKKRFLSLILAMVLVLAALPITAFAADVVASGTCGENLTWELTSDGALTISGTGEMYDYNYPDETPWSGTVSHWSVKQVTIVEGVTSIGAGAFNNCLALSDVVIPTSVRKIGGSAFLNCNKLTSITIPDGVTSIEPLTFCFCSNLLSVYVPDSISNIGEAAFSGCTNLTNITLPDGVSTIEDNAFSGCATLTSVNIPVGIASIGDGAFSSCSNLVSINVPEGHSCYSSISGVLFCKPFGWGSELLVKQVPGAISGAYVIPDGVTGIADYAFAGCSSLTDLAIPGDVEVIGEYAFKGCVSLGKLVIPDGVSGIAYSCFSDCTSLVDISIPDSITFIKESAFSNCASLASITIPKGVTYIGESSFSGCTNLASIDVAEGNLTYSSIDGVLFNKSKTQIVRVPCAICSAYTVPESVKDIGTLAFADCSKLDAVIFLGDAPTIDTFSFSGVTATAYYPEDNNTWTEEYLQDYGGTLTWVAGLPEEPPTENFSDVSEADYFYAPVLWAFSEGITTGTTPTTFSPNNACTRAQIVTFLWRAMGEPEPRSNTTPFTDLNKNEYYYKAVLWAVEEGITTGMTATTFEPNRACTRSQAVTFLWRAAGCPATSAKNPFVDIPSKQWYTEAVLWAVEQGITTGMSADKFAPNDTCTRAHIVTFLYRDLCER